MREEGGEIVPRVSHRQQNIIIEFNRAGDQEGGMSSLRGHSVGGNSRSSSSSGNVRKSERGIKRTEMPANE
jgi:hypothetical protein